MEPVNHEQSHICSLGIASVPKQVWGDLYDVKTALREGTLFKDLNMPFFMGGDNVGK